MYQDCIGLDLLDMVCRSLPAEGVDLRELCSRRCCTVDLFFAEHRFLVFISYGGATTTSGTTPKVVSVLWARLAAEVGTAVNAVIMFVTSCCADGQFQLLGRGLGGDVLYYIVAVAAVAAGVAWLHGARLCECGKVVKTSRAFLPRFVQLPPVKKSCRVAFRRRRACSGCKMQVCFC